VAVGVYLGLTVLDFPFCFLLVKIVGTEKIGTCFGAISDESFSLTGSDQGEIEHFVVSNVQKIIPQSMKDWWREYRVALKKAETKQLGSDEISETVEMAGWGVKEAEERNKVEASKCHLFVKPLLAHAIGLFTKFCFNI
jgi:N-terminal acetyltransferase 2